MILALLALSHPPELRFRLRSQSPRCAKASAAIGYPGAIAFSALCGVLPTCHVAWARAASHEVVQVLKLVEAREQQ